MILKTNLLFPGHSHLPRLTLLTETGLLLGYLDTRNYRWLIPGTGNAFFDSWSIDSWIVLPDGGRLIPSREKGAAKVQWTDSLSVLTKSENDKIQLESEVKVILENGIPVCRIYLKAMALSDGYLIIALRPYNPEGVSFINRIELLKNLRVVYR